MKRIVLPVLYFILYAIGFTAFLTLLSVLNGSITLHGTIPSISPVRLIPKAIYYSLIPGATLGLVTQFHRISRVPLERYLSGALLVIIGTAGVFSLFTTLSPQIVEKEYSDEQKYILIPNTIFSIDDHGLWLDEKTESSLKGVIQYRDGILREYESADIIDKYIRLPEGTTIEIDPPNPVSSFLISKPQGAEILSSLFKMTTEFFQKTHRKSRALSLMTMLVFGLFLFSMCSFEYITPWPLGNLMLGIGVFLGLLTLFFTISFDQEWLFLTSMGTAATLFIICDIIQTIRHREAL